MPILGRSLGATAVEQLTAIFNTNITSADEGKVVYFDNAASEYKLLASIDVALLVNNLVGVISAVTVDGDTLGAQGAGYVVLKGVISKTGAVAGEAFFIGASAAVVKTPPGGEPAIRVGYSKQNDFLYVDIDPQAVQVAILNNQVEDLQTQVVQLQTDLDDLILQNQTVAVYDYSNGDGWGTNPETTNTDYGLDDFWTEGTVEYNSDFGADDNWGVLVE
jgi:hypothetical protein